MYEFDYAISFSRDCRDVARELARQLDLRGSVVFYDESYRADLLGKRLDHEFVWVFGAGTRFFVPIVSAVYAERTWPQYEWAIARQEAAKRQEEFILPLRMDDSLLVGLADTVSYLDLRRHSVDKVADLLIEKLRGPRVDVTHERSEQTWVATFGLLMQDLRVFKDVLPAEAPSDYVDLCDWLTRDLEYRLARTDLVGPRFTEDARNGESLSLRVAFEWGPAKGPLTFGELEWWTLLDLQPYNTIYGSASNVGGISQE